MPLLEEQTQPEITVDPSALEPGTEPKHRRRMLLALALLLCALILVLVKDRDFWFPAPAEEEVAEEASPTTDQAQPHAATAAPVKAKQFKAKTHRSPEPAAPAAVPDSAPEVNRAVLPPLEVEVVAGDQRQTIRSGNNSVKLDLGSGSPPLGPASTSAPSGSGVSSATERVRLSPGTAQVVSRPVEPTYPMLAKQMKVQGAVVLKVFIGKEGNIQNLSVLSGPAILSAAAREAVMQWRFKPYFVGGQPVETEARVTVNFTISTQ